MPHNRAPILRTREGMTDPLDMEPERDHRGPSHPVLDIHTKPTAIDQPIPRFGQHRRDQRPPLTKRQRVFVIGVLEPDVVRR